MAAPRRQRGVDPSRGPQPGIHNWLRGGTLRTFEGTIRSVLPNLTGHIDIDRARQVWAEALSAPWDGIDRWFHGDIAAGNLRGHTHITLHCPRADPCADSRTRQRGARPPPDYARQRARSPAHLRAQHQCGRG